MKLLRDIFYSLLTRTPYDLWIFRFGILFEAGKNIHTGRIGERRDGVGVERLNTSDRLPPLTQSPYIARAAGGFFNVCSKRQSVAGDARGSQKLICVMH